MMSSIYGLLLEFASQLLLCNVLIHSFAFFPFFTFISFLTFFIFEAGE
jgi:hypothetical protein